MSCAPFFPLIHGLVRLVRSGGASAAAVAALAIASARAAEPAPARPPATSYAVRVWSQDEGLPQNHITAIAQTDDGYLWFGTYDGLVRFDGVRFVVHDGINTPALRDGRIVSLLTARDGSLWIGHEDGHVTRLRHGRFTAVRAAPERGALGVEGFCEDASGQIWTVDQRGTMARVDAPGPAGTPATGMPDFVMAAVDTDGTVWETHDGRLARLEGGALQPMSVAKEWKTNTVYGLGASRRGGIWISNEGRLQRWQQGRCVEDWGPAPWSARTLTALVELRDGAVAIGTLDQGLYVWEPGRAPQAFDVAAGFPHNWVRSVFEDAEGDLWVGTGGGGLVTLRAAPFLAVQPPTGWQGRSVLAVAPSRAGGLWVGTEGAGLFYLVDGQWKHYGAADGLANPFVWSLAESPAGELFAGTWGGGLFRRGGDDRFRRDPRIDPAGIVPALAVAGGRGRNWFGTSAGLVGLADDGAYAPPGTTAARPTAESASIRLGLAEGLRSTDVRAVVEDDGGTVWFGLLGGGLASYAPDGTLRQFHVKDGLSTELVLCLLPDRDGSLWIGTSGGGINRLKHGRIAVVNTSQGLPSNIVGHLLEDDDGHVWISSHTGIFRVDRAELRACADGAIPAVHARRFGRSDGLPTLEIAGGQGMACRTPDGELWFCTTKGLVHVNPRTLPVNLRPPPLVIEELRTGGGARPLGASPVAIEAGAQRIQIRYTALSLAAPEKVQFRHRLVGFDDHWTEAGTERETAYQALPPGAYRFEVTACNNDGVWAPEPAVRAFVVLPFYWQTWWFRAGVAALAIGGASLAGIGLARRRMRRQLERAERQQAIERERARIARDIHDDLGSSLTRITLLTQTVLAEADASRGIAPELAQIYGTARDVTRSMDEIVWAVNPRHDSLDSLANFVGKFAQDLLRAARVRCRLDFPITLPDVPLTAEVRHHVFLAAKEVLHNIVKHAGAAEVRIALAVTPAGFRLTIEDDGRGFQPGAGGAAPADPSRPAAGNGLPNLARRLAEIGGTCEIASEPGKGTRTTFTVAFRGAQR